MVLNRRQALITVAATASSVWPVASLHAQQQSPTQRTIRVIVPYPAGGNADAIARVYADAMTQRTGAVVIVDNRPGASGTIGAEAVLRAEPDGNTLLVTVTSQLTSSALNVKPSYDAPRDFAAITGLCVTPLILAAPASLRVRNMREFVALAKTRAMAFGSYGAGTGTHVLQTIFSRQMGADMVHVPYKGEAPMVTDLAAGQIQMGMVPPGVALSMAKAGKLQPLATMGESRSEFLPQLPTLSELGYRDLDWTYGVGVYVSARTPATMVAQLERLGQEIMNSPDVKAKYRAQSNQPWGAGAAALQKRLVVDSVLWNKTLNAYGKIE